MGLVDQCIYLLITQHASFKRNKYNQSKSTIVLPNIKQLHRLILKHTSLGKINAMIYSVPLPLQSNVDFHCDSGDKVSPRGHNQLENNKS